MSPVDIEKLAFEDLCSEIREVIDDPARESEALALVDSLVDDLASLREKISFPTRLLTIPACPGCIISSAQLRDMDGCPACLAGKI